MSNVRQFERVYNVLELTKHLIIVHLFFNVLDLFPLALEILLPERDPIVSSADG